MRKTLLILLLLPFCASAQKDTVGLNMPFVDGNITYEGVIDLPNRTKSDLFKASKQWFVDAFRSANEVIQNQDYESGRISGKGITSITYTGFGGATYPTRLTIQIDVKDNKYRYRLYDIVLTAPGFYTSLLGSISAADFTAESLYETLLNKGEKRFPKGRSKKMLLLIDAEAKRILTTLQSAMIKGPDTF